ncbi:MAG: helix-hairpin-helix domain-containing protein, partial [Bellilinea sp.]
PDGKPVLYLGLDQVRDLTNRTIQQILLKRPFNSLDDFLARVDPRPVEARNLIRCGALSGLGSIPTLLNYLEKGPRRPGQPSLFDQPIVDEMNEWTLHDRINAQQEILGVGIDAHALELFADRLNTIQAVSTADALIYPGNKVVVAGVRQSHHRSRTSTGEIMAFLTLEDFEGTLDVILFPNVYRATRKEVFSENLPIIIEGTVETDANREEPFLRADRVYLVE